MGLGTVWLAATIDRKAFERALGVGADEVMPAVSPIGYAAEKRSVRESLMRRNMRSDERAPFEELFFRGGFDHPLVEGEAGSLLRPLQMVRWSPSATNKQPWRLVFDGSKVHFYEHRTRGYARKSTGDIQKVDMGIAACHFQIAAEEAGLPGEFLKEDPGLRAPEDTDYVTTYATSAGTPLL
ncbi:nitroreductase family protein [Parafannyhessea umbonata]|uniref:nitroreductase family protein n=1 Tax=Parafannyhessea umbonata TaxID=604330 RepID=UPI0026EE95AF|nr:nitroreductase family protein [Parafannyhessea umbonata]MDD6601580.1 nitroreductase family protein [Parafannyhessea umbonata]